MTPSTTRQRGIAAIELAILLPLIIILATSVIFIARVLMSYSIAHKAAQSAAVYLATVPMSDMMDTSRKTAAQTIAGAVADITLAEVKPGGREPIVVDVHCDGLTCAGPTPPKEISVTVRMWMMDDFFFSQTGGIIPDGGLPLTVVVTIPYLGA